MGTRQDYIDAVGKLVQGEIPLGEPDRIFAVDTAVEEHARHRPRKVVEDFSGDGGFDYPISGFASWTDGFSAIKQVEYPVDDTDRTADILQRDEWAIYEKPAGKYLRFRENTPEAGESFRVTYFAMHICNDTQCTIEGGDEKAVQALAAAIFCEMLATYYAQSHDASIAADNVDHSSKSRDYSARAKVYRKSYFDHLGIREGQTQAASVTHDWDQQGSWGSDKLTHKKDYR